MTPKTTREHVRLAQDVLALLLLLDHMAVAGPETQVKLLAAARKSLRTKCEDVCYPNRPRHKNLHAAAAPPMFDNTPDATTTVD